MSGVFDLLQGEGQASVFGNDAAVRRAASPIFYVASGAPPFLITYCQWDYATLPGQAREFDSALRHAGVPSSIIYVPGESHISEMVHVPNPGDPTSEAVLKFVRMTPEH